jgi:hypothetical protein
MIPTFETEFLSEVGDSVRRRQKAMKHRAFGLSCERLWETTDGTKREKLELTLLGPPSSRSAQLRFFVWSDRWIFVDAREGSKLGWKWEWTIEGKILGGVTGRDLIKAVESSYAASPFFSDLDFLDEIKSIWKSLLAARPSLVG